MSDPHIRAAFYLSPTLDAFWRWSRDGEVLTWADDSTIAFRPEIEAVLRRLAPGGLPPFGAVALVLAACRNGWTTSTGRETIAKYVNVFGTMSTETSAVQGAQIVFGRVVRDVRLLLEGLDALSQLPADLRQGIDAKSLLAEVVFDAARNRSTVADAEGVIRAFDEGIDANTLRPQLCNEELLSQFAHQVDGLHEGLARIDPDALARRAATGIDLAVSPASDDLSLPQRVRQLLAELRDDPELAGLAQLAADLMAAVGVPRKLRSHEELSLGGVSDISNRGPLDRLLISELAHDDLTLAVRVAVNEALYLRRETPPREPPNRRAILIDSGIRMWGVPRVFAAAVALAMTALHDPKAELSTFRAALVGIAPIDLTRRGGLESHLSVLEPASHPGASLNDFAANVNDREAGDCDPILITHPDVLTDPEFLSAVRFANLSAMYVATVDREGSFRLHALTGKGILLIREASLSLDAILNPRPIPARCRPVPLLAEKSNQKLPAIFHADPFPLLLFHIPSPKRSCASETFGLIAATRDGRILQWKDRFHGAFQIASDLPFGSVRLIFLDRYFKQVKVLTTPQRGLDLRPGYRRSAKRSMCFPADPIARSVANGGLSLEGGPLFRLSRPGRLLRHKPRASRRFGFRATSACA